MGAVRDTDTRAFLDATSHDGLMRLLEHRIGDRRILRLVGRWLKAGGLEDDAWAKGAVGTPRGAVISPLLANASLHHVHDLWVQQWRHRHAHGDMIAIRYAGVTIIGPQAGEVRVGTSSWENPPDPVRSIRGSESSGRGNRGVGKL